MSAVEGAQDLTSVVRRYGALLAIAESVASRQELPEVVQASRLQPVVSFELIQLALYDPDRTVLRQQWVTMEGAASVERLLGPEDLACSRAFDGHILSCPDAQRRHPVPQSRLSSRATLAGYAPCRPLPA
jgi:hypothetical protein